MIEPIPPAAILIAGALLVPFFKGRLKKAYLLVLPTLAFLNLLYMPAGKYWIADFLHYNLIFGRVDKLIRSLESRPSLLDEVLGQARSLGHVEAVIDGQNIVARGDPLKAAAGLRPRAT